MSLLYDSNNPGLSPELQQWYEEVFMDAYNDEVTEQEKREEEDKQPEEQELSITTAHLIKKHKELSKSGKSRGGYKEENSHQIHQKYLDRLINAGYIEDEKIEGKKAKLYRPVKDLKYSFCSFSNEKNIFPYKLKMKIENSELFPTKEVLELQISDSLKCSSKYSEKGKINFQLVDVNGDEISPKELVDRYFRNPEDYFVNKADGKEDARQDLIKKGQKTGQEYYTVRQHLEEHIPILENDNKSHVTSEDNKNNVQNIPRDVEDNVLLVQKEQIAHSKALSPDRQDEGESNPEYIYGNENDDEEYLESQ